MSIIDSIKSFFSKKSVKHEDCDCDHGHEMKEGEACCATGEKCECGDGTCCEQK